MSGDDTVTTVTVLPLSLFSSTETCEGLLKTTPVAAENRKKVTIAMDKFFCQPKVDINAPAHDKTSKMTHVCPTQTQISPV